jgi:pimeloyl-ACP methyl ester carboxylesterase
VALAWALDAPDSVDALLLVSAPSHVWPGGLGFSTDLLADPLTGPLLARTLPAVLPRSFADAAVQHVFAPQSPPPGYLAHIRLDLVLTPGALRANAQQLAALKNDIRAMVPRYPTLAMPVELVHGTADATVPLEIHSEPLAREIPGARLTRLQGIGHMPHHAALPEVLTSGNAPARSSTIPTRWAAGPGLPPASRIRTSTTTACPTNGKSDTAWISTTRRPATKTRTETAIPTSRSS